MVTQGGLFPSAISPCQIIYPAESDISFIIHTEGSTVAISIAMAVPVPIDPFTAYPLCRRGDEAQSERSAQFGYEEYRPVGGRARLQMDESRQQTAFRGYAHIVQYAWVYVTHILCYYIEEILRYGFDICRRDIVSIRISGSPSYRYIRQDESPMSGIFGNLRRKYSVISEGNIR